MPVSTGARLSSSPPLRVATYNLRSGLGPRWRLFAPRTEVEANLRAVAAHLARATPAATPLDAVGLNEVDLGSRRSGWLDQADFVARELERLTGHRYEAIRGPTWRRELPGLEVRFGNALLVRHRLIGVDHCRLGVTCKGSLGDRGPAEPRQRGWAERLLGEPRAVIVARIDFHGAPLEILVTHLDPLSTRQRQAEATEIVSALVRPGLPTVLLGDMNAVPASASDGWRYPRTDQTYAILTSGSLIDARAELAEHRGMQDLASWATYPATAPRWPLDGIFATPDLLAQHAQVIGALESDHRGLQVRYTRLSSRQAARRRDAHCTGA